MNFNEPDADSQATLWTAQVQYRHSTTKPVRLIEVGTGEYGKFARIEFADEVTRPVYLPTMEDAWHPLFDSLTGDERWKIRDFFSPFESQALPGGNVKKNFNLSFVTRVETKSGKFVSENNFDVPAESYGDGELTGVRAAREYMAALSLPNFGCTSLMDIVREISTCFEEHENLKSGDLSRGNVAVSFLRELEVMLRFSAKNCNHQNYFEQHVAQRIAYAEQNRKYEEANRRVTPNTRKAKSASEKAVSMSI